MLLLYDQIFCFKGLNIGIHVLKSLAIVLKKLHTSSARCPQLQLHIAFFNCLYCLYFYMLFKGCAAMPFFEDKGKAV